MIAFWDIESVCTTETSVYFNETNSAAYQKAMIFNSKLIFTCIVYFKNRVGKCTAHFHFFGNVNKTLQTLRITTPLLISALQFVNAPPLYCCRENVLTLLPHSTRWTYPVSMGTAVNGASNQQNRNDNWNSAVFLLHSWSDNTTRGFNILYLFI
jgi:hypothetical protein